MAPATVAPAAVAPAVVAVGSGALTVLAIVSAATGCVGVGVVGGVPSVTSVVTSLGAARLCTWREYAIAASTAVE